MDTRGKGQRRGEGTCKGGERETQKWSQEERRGERSEKEKSEREG